MPRQYVNSLKDGDPVDEVFLLADRQLRANRNANLYLLASLRDRTGLINGLMWNVTEDSTNHLNAGDFVRVRGKVQLYQGALQMIVTNIGAVGATGLDPADFHPASSQDTTRLMARVQEILLGIDDPKLRTLMECFLVDEPLMNAFRAAPAGVKAHHAYHGGLLEHVANILETAVRIADLYPKVDRNLLLAGIFLHDMGKVREMASDASFVYTDEGQLVGHLVIGVEILNEKIAEVQRLTGEDFPHETALRLKHLILSHHGEYAFGSPKLPMTPEAIALHHLDNLDAKVHEFTRSIAEDPNSGSNWTPYSQRLERKLYKGRTNGDVP
ncbi:MAG TPA: HD domain-containing protein [Planctomycetaceae bacterium]|nr:HD domain-containing protein [Planctomycetaceae bacterium]